MDFLLGILAGLLTMLAANFYKTKITPPRLVFGGEICRQTYSDGSIGFKYIYKNIGERRLIDVAMKAIITIPEMVPDNLTLKQVIRFDMENHHRFVVDADKEISNKLMIDENSLKANKILSALLEQEMLRGDDITIDVIRQLSNNIEIQISILGTDELTGIRKVFESKRYTTADIRNGVFDRKTLVVVGTLNRHKPPVS